MLDSKTKNRETLAKENKANLFSIISVILSITAILASVFTLIYVVKGYQFSKSSLTVELHRYFIDNQLFGLNEAYLVRFSNDASFYEENKKDIEELFNTATYFPFEGKLDTTKEGSSGGDSAQNFLNLANKYSDSFKNLEAENNRLRNEIIGLIYFYNKLGTFLQNGLLDEDLAKRLFDSDFKLFYDWYFVPCAFLYGGFLDNQFYLYLTGERYEAPFWKIVHFTNVSEKYKNIDPKQILKVPKDGIFFLSSRWK